MNETFPPQLTPERLAAEENIFRMVAGRIGNARKASKSLAAAEESKTELTRLLKDIVDLDDRIGDAINLVDDVETMEKAEFEKLLAGLRASVESVLKNRKIYRVSTIGKDYDEVEHDGQLVEHPWEEEGEESEDTKLRELRSLWVRSDRGRIKKFRQATRIWKK